MEYYKKKSWIDMALEPLENLLFGVGKGKNVDNVSDFLARVRPEKNATLELEVEKVGKDLNMMINENLSDTMQINLRYADKYQSTLMFYNGADSNTTKNAKMDAIEIGKEIERNGFNVRIMNRTLEEYKKLVLEQYSL